jgi:ribosome-associated protein
MVKNMPPDIKNVEIDREPVELYKILKFENLVASGGEAKFVISQGLVRVNNEKETRKRKKIFAGDVIEYNNERFRIVVQ